MTNGDIAQVLEVDRECYPLPWPASAYRRELGNNSHARYLVLRELPMDEDAHSPTVAEERRSWRNLLTWPRAASGQTETRSGHLIGYAGMWIVADEAHVTTIAVRAAKRGNGFGELLLASLIAMAVDMGICWVTLEVRVSNEVAQKLYRKYGFRDAGLRRRYYSDNNEDALIMTTDDITLNAYQTHFEALKSSLLTRLNAPPAIETRAPMLAAGNSRP